VHDADQERDHEFDRASELPVARIFLENDRRGRADSSTAFRPSPRAQAAQQAASELAGSSAIAGAGAAGVALSGGGGTPDASLRSLFGSVARSVTAAVGGGGGGARAAASPAARPLAAAATPAGGAGAAGVLARLARSDLLLFERYF